MTTRRRYEGPLSIDPRIARLLRVRLRLPRALVEDIVRAQCYVKVDRYADGWCSKIPFVRGERHGIAWWWRADGSRWGEIPYVRGERHGIETLRYPDGSRASETSWVSGRRHGTSRWWRADGTVSHAEVWVHGVRR